MIRVRTADLENEADAQAVVTLIDGYARGPGGQSAPLAEQAREQLVPGLRAHPRVTVLLAFQDARPLGVAVLVENFSTFAGRPFLNVHDLAVDASAQGRGVGTALLAEAERLARSRGCCKVTLEVHGTNEGAKRLYTRLGFESLDEPDYYLTRKL